MKKINQQVFIYTFIFLVFFTAGFFIGLGDADSYKKEGGLKIINYAKNVQVKSKAQRAEGSYLDDRKETIHQAFTKNEGESLDYFKLEFVNSKYFEMITDVFEKNIKYIDSKNPEKIKNQKLINKEVLNLMKNKKEWFKKEVEVDSKGLAKVYLFANYERFIEDGPKNKLTSFEEGHHISINYFYKFENKWEMDQRSQDISFYQTYKSENVVENGLDYESYFALKTSIISFFVGIPAKTNYVAGLVFQNKNFVWIELKNTPWVHSSESEFESFKQEIEEKINLEEK